MHASPAYTETELEALAGCGPAAFEQFYRDHHARIYNLAARIVGDPDDAADITQEVFLRAYTHPIQAGGDPRPEPWLYRIAVNASYDHLRRRAARPSTSLDTVAEIPDTGDGFVDGELSHCIEACLACLTPRYRTALVLKDLHGLSHAEIAEVMDIHQGAARVLLHRARAAFRRAFRSTAPTGAGGVSMLGLAAFLPELPVPASLQTPPAFASLVPQAAWPATSAPHLAGAAPGAGQAGLSGATSAASAPIAAAPAASVPLAVAPAASVPLAVAPIAPVGLLAGLGGAAGVKVAIAVVAVAVVAGGGLAARHGALDATRVDDPAGRVRAGGTTSQVAQPADAPKSYRKLVGEQYRFADSYRGDRDGGGTAGATRDGAGSGGGDAASGNTTGGIGTGGGGTGAAGANSGSGAAGQVTGADHPDGTGKPGPTTGGGNTNGGDTTTGGDTTGGGTGTGGDPTGGGDTGGSGTGSGGRGG